ncbi:Mini-ribonuclease 3 [Thermoactinomyces sp. AMNI-1]|uniref:Mini-ribonuclease 3 n=2 Tax=Thermoactinomyces mirandus TaxID=2756294 RepID=A0A7W1XTS9_9BACL|nr:Mini-ribonuclease 3 [Thermoactinomyces mirandus]
MLDPLTKLPHEHNPLLLAYIGDAVYEMFIRHHLIARGVVRPQDLQKEAVKFVSAFAQSHVYRTLEDGLTEEERDILKRGRNAKSGSVPKNARVSDYRQSTGLEALIGYLYLKGEEWRLHELMRTAIEIVEKKEYREND